MPTPRSIAVATVLVLAGLTAAARADQTLTYPDLVGRLTDLARLAVLPDRGETCAQWSSYDRASRYDEKTGKYVNWDANGDGGGIIRSEGDQVVMAEMKGPGCIWRIWSAAPGKGHVKIYLDGQPAAGRRPAVRPLFRRQARPIRLPAALLRPGQGPFERAEPLSADPVSEVVQGGGRQGLGQLLPLQLRDLSRRDHGPDLQRRAGRPARRSTEGGRTTSLPTSLGTDPAGKRAGQKTLVRSVRAAPGQTVRRGPARRPAGDHRPVGQDETRRSGRPDDRPPQAGPADHLGRPVEAGRVVPAGRFLRHGPRREPLQDASAGHDHEGVLFLLVHAVRQERLGRAGQRGRDASGRSSSRSPTRPLERPFEGLAHFHAKWHRDTVELPKDRWPDWIMLRTQGRGRFCGVSLHVWNPRGGWWGEGDEKFFVDGEKFPSTFGTGSEDYFGYAWGCPNLFQKPYHCQSMTQGNQGHQSLARWHIVDNVPFQKSFEGCIEKYYPNDRGTLYACTARWYLAPGGKDAYGPVPAEQRDGYYTRPELVVNGFTVLNEPPGEAQVQKLNGFGTGQWKNDQQLWWTGAGPGGKLELGVPVAATGRYEVSVRLTKAQRLRHRAAFAGRQEGGRADRPLQPERHPHGPDRPGHIRFDGRPAHLDGRDSRRQSAGQEVLHVRHHPARCEGGEVSRLI